MCPGGAPNSKKRSAEHAAGSKRVSEAGGGFLDQLPDPDPDPDPAFGPGPDPDPAFPDPGADPYCLGGAKLGVLEAFSDTIFFHACRTCFGVFGAPFGARGAPPIPKLVKMAQIWRKTW